MRSAHYSNLHPHKWFNLKDGNFTPLINSSSDIEITNMPRQSFPKIYIPNGYIDIVRHSTLKYHGKFHGNKIKSFITDITIDIDDEIDLQSARENKEIFELSKLIKKI